MKINKQEQLKKLLEEYFELFPNSYLFPDWKIVTYDDKINMLKEAIKDNKHILETELYKKKYMETI